MLFGAWCTKGRRERGLTQTVLTLQKSGGPRGERTPLEHVLLSRPQAYLIAIEPAPTPEASAAALLRFLLCAVSSSNFAKRRS